MDQSLSYALQSLDAFAASDAELVPYVEKRELRAGHAVTIGVNVCLNH